uniref:Uncharacterized protein n=1 Tax=Panagrolaimus davidi TaxID=227884 RepID=A0A914R6V2_9BILA
MKATFLLKACLIAAIFVGVESAIAKLQVEKGKEAKIDFGNGMFFIKRITKASPKPQYYFAHPKQDGTWTTDGKDKIPSTAFLHWNGTMTFKKIGDNDAGTYEMPLEPSRLPMAQSVFSVVFKLPGEHKTFEGGK